MDGLPLFTHLAVRVFQRLACYLLQIMLEAIAAIELVVDAQSKSVGPFPPSALWCITPWYIALSYVRWSDGRDAWGRLLFKKLTTLIFLSMRQRCALSRSVMHLKAAVLI